MLCNVAKRWVTETCSVAVAQGVRRRPSKLALGWETGRGVGVEWPRPETISINKMQAKPARMISEYELELNKRSSSR